MIVEFPHPGKDSKSLNKKQPEIERSPQLNSRGDRNATQKHLYHRQAMPGFFSSLLQVFQWA